MGRIFGSSCSKRRGRQASGGRTRTRAIVPITLLGACMVAALYGNVWIYAGTSTLQQASGSPDSRKSAADGPERGGGTEGTKPERTVEQEETNAVIALAVELPPGGSAVQSPPEQGGLAVEIPVEEALQEAPTVVSSLQQWGLVDEGGQGKKNEVRSLNGREIVGRAVEVPSKEAVQEAPTVVSSLQQWGIMDQDDERIHNEERSPNGGEIVDATKASEKDLKVKGPVSPKDSAGGEETVVKGPVSLNKDGTLDNGTRRAETRTADPKNEAVGVLALSPAGGGGEDGAGGKEGQEDKERKEGLKGEAGRGAGHGGEQAENGSADMPEGVAASSTPSTGDVVQEANIEDWVGNAFVEALRGVSASSTTSTRNAIQEEEEEEKKEERLENGSVEMLLGVAASLTPSTTNVIREEETKNTGVRTGNTKTLEGAAASSTPSTRGAIQEHNIKGDEGVGTRNVEVIKRVTPGSAPSTRDVIQEQKKEGVERGVGPGNVEMLGGSAASSTPSTGDIIPGEQQDAAAKGRADGNMDGATGQVAVAGAVLSGNGGPYLVMDVSKENGEVIPNVQEETKEEEGEGGMGETGETDFAGAAMGGTSDESTMGVGAFPNGAVQGSMECANTREGEGVTNIANIATWKDVPGDAAYRGPLYRGLSEGNATQYLTLEKDLGGFNNIRMSLECAVAIAAATGRTFVIPPPFSIWGMNTGGGKMEVDLRDLFSFDKLRESGRVSVITTEEFIEKEALSGNLGIWPSENAMRMDETAVRQYLEKVAGGYTSGLPTFKVDNSALVMPRRLDQRVDLGTPPYELAKEWLFGRKLVEYRESWQEAKVIHWRSHNARLLAPFYALVLHTDEVADRYYKRLMRDLMHYPEEVYCKASQVIALLRQEDPSGSFSTFHIRRNDFLSAYKDVVIPPADVAASSLDHLTKNEVIYIATDEMNLSLFDPFKDRARVRFLSDYYERAGLSELNPNLLGMLEQVIASHGRTFTGSWLSTFTAYIFRLRGYIQMPRKSNFLYYPPKRTYHHISRMPQSPLWATEWPFGWEDIDSSGVPDAMAP